MHGTSSGGLILSTDLRDDSVGDVGVNRGGDKPLIHYRLIEVNIEDSLPSHRFPLRLHLWRMQEVPEKLISKTKSQLVSGSCTFKLNCRIEVRRIIGGTGQGQLTFRSNANATPTFHHHHLHSPAGTYLGRGAAAATRLEGIPRGHAVTLHGSAVRDVPLYFSSEPLVNRAR
ncbi:uncharacterized protein LOC126848823 [Cataglyphis hispanica]|uniref:uncharacterized protein LOC126848823 n=1 Tax=Cataglyphis hispanica TaxID=1086592 RepID=UPI00218027E9|nr:uncharacterized protein LOC126848823 [Cataglyphis hispanica]